MRVIALFCLIFFALPARAEVTVFAAASLRGALDAVNAEFEGEVIVSYASSAALARQIAQGASADVFLSANPDWVDYLVNDAFVDVQRHGPFLGNELVLIGSSQARDATLATLTTVLEGRNLATALTTAVPAGIYARQTLETFSLWQDAQPHLVETDNVRAALALVSLAETGQDVRSVTQESLRQHIGMVTQETAMFNRSALENIRYGRPDASKEEVIAAAKQAHAHEFIVEMQDFKGRAGYDAHLGERGVKLSGGQRQRIALARAILKDAPILVLDEATSALDSEVEAEIQEALHEVVIGKTVIAIAHRLSTIAEMDRIIVMDQGRIVEEGSHAELLARDGLYAGFWRRQSGGFIGAEAAE